MGYAFGVELPEDSQHVTGAPFGTTLSNPFTPPFIGRYAYDTRCHDLVIIVHGGQPAFIGIKSMSRKTPICREQSTIVVPSAEYAFDALPTTVLSMLSNIEYRLHQLEFEYEMKKGAHAASLRFVNTMRPIERMPRHPLRTMHGSIADGSWLSELLSSDSISLPSPMVLPDLWNEHCDEAGCENNIGEDTDMHDVAASSHFPWFVDDGGVSADGMAYAGGGGECNTSSGAFARKRLEIAVRVLKNDILGKYYGPSVRMDSLHLLTGQYSSMYTGRITYKVDSVQEASLSYVRNAFAQDYYLAVLSVTADNSLSVEIGGGKGFQGSPEESRMRCDRPISAGSMGPLLVDEVTGTNKYEADPSTGFGAVASHNSTAFQTKIPQPDAIHGSGIITHSEGHKNPAYEAIDCNVSTLRSENASQELSITLARRKHPAPLAPRLTVQSVDIGVVNNCGDSTQPCAALAKKRVTRRGRGSVGGDKARHALILEERKKRNRLSAARSNHRKKEEMEAVKKEIKANRTLVTELLERRKAFEVENKRLKRLLQDGRTSNVG